MVDNTSIITNQTKKSSKMDTAETISHFKWGPDSIAQWADAYPLALSLWCIRLYVWSSPSGSIDPQWRMVDRTPHLDFTITITQNELLSQCSSIKQGLMNSKHWTWNPSHPRKAGTSRLSPCGPLPVQFGRQQLIYCIYPQATGRSCGPSDRRILSKFIQIASKSQMSLSLHTITYLHKYGLMVV